MLHEHRGELKNKTKQKSRTQTTSLKQTFSSLLFTADITTIIADCFSHNFKSTSGNKQQAISKSLKKILSTQPEFIGQSLFQIYIIWSVIYYQRYKPTNLYLLNSLSFCTETLHTSHSHKQIYKPSLNPPVADRKSPPSPEI